MAILQELANRELNRFDVLRGVRLVVVLEHAELSHRFFEFGIVAFDDGVIILARFPRCVDAAIVDVRDVLHVRNAVAAVHQISPQHVEKEKRTSVAEMRLGRRREATDVDSHLVVAQRLELLDAARASVVESHGLWLRSPSSRLLLPMPRPVPTRPAAFPARRADAAGALWNRSSDRASRPAGGSARREPACRLARRRAPARRLRSRLRARL